MFVTTCLLLAVACLGFISSANAEDTPASPASAAPPSVSSAPAAPVTHAASGAPVAAKPSPPALVTATAPEPVPALRPVASSPPPELKLPPMSLTGHARVRHENSELTDLVSKRDFTLFRIRPTLSIFARPEMTVVIEPQFSRTAGEMVEGTGGGAAVQSSGNSTDPTLLVHQAFVDYRLGDFTLRLGRTALAYGDEIIVGAAEWGNIARSFDAVRVRYTYSLGTLDSFASKLVETNASTAGPGDKDFYGMYSSMNLGAGLKAVDAYVLYLRDTSVAKSMKVGTFGVRAKSNVGQLLYRVEAATQWESSAGNEGYQADLELGWQSEAKHKLMLSLEGFTTGKTYEQMFPTAHRWLGYADLFARKNISGGVAHLSVKPRDHFTAQLDYHQFLRTNASAPAYKMVSPSTAIGSPSKSASKELGSEIDASLFYEVNDTLTLSGAYCVFFLGEYMRQQYPWNDTKFFYLQALLKF